MTSSPEILLSHVWVNLLVYDFSENLLLQPVSIYFGSYANLNQFTLEIYTVTDYDPWSNQYQTKMHAAVYYLLD